MAFTTTTHYNLTKPNINEEFNIWGTEYNNNLDTIDGTMNTIAVSVTTLATTVSAINTDPSNYVLP